MVYVVLRDGRVLEYNEATKIAVDKGTIAVENKQWLVARIPLDVVERVEFDKPCRISKEYKKKKYVHY